MIQTKSLNKLIETHSWTAILGLLGDGEPVALRFPDIDALESFRAFVYQKNAYEKRYKISVRRRLLEVSITKWNSF